MQKLPDTELEIMQVIWQENRVLSTSEIKEKLDLSRPWNVSALQTVDFFPVIKKEKIAITKSL